MSLTCLLDPCCRGFGWLPSPSALSLACLSNSFYLGFGWLPSPSVLSFTCLLNSRHLGFGWLPSVGALGLTCLSDLRYLELGMFARPMLSWIWWIVKSKCLRLAWFAKFKCLRIDWLPSSNALDLTCLSDPSYIGPSGLSSLNASGSANTLSLTWLIVKFKCRAWHTVKPPTWGIPFPWACLREKGL